MSPEGIRRHKVYTPLGRKVSRLAKNQAELAQVLRLSQQSVSGKLLGKIAITLHDLEQLAAHYRVPLIYFVTPESVTKDEALSLERMLQADPALLRAIVQAEHLPLPFQRRLPAIVDILNQMAAELLAR